MNTPDQPREARVETVPALSWLADVGELSGPLAHEFNNYLNCVLLHVAVLETEMGGPLQPELAAIRRLGADMAALVRDFQQSRRRELPDPPGADLNAAVLEALARLGVSLSETSLGPAGKILTPEGEVTLQTQLAGDLPQVAAPVADLERLGRFLISNSVAVLKPAGGSVTVRTERKEAAVVLTVEDSGPGLPPAALARYFDLSPCRRPGLDTMEMAACKSLVNRLGGKIQALIPPAGGLAVRAQLPPV